MMLNHEKKEVLPPPTTQSFPFVVESKTVMIKTSNNDNAGGYARAEADLRFLSPATQYYPTTQKTYQERT
jgi:hypothetical protein